MEHPPCAHTLAAALRQSVPLLTRFLKGFDDSTRAAQAPGLPNHPIWILGHCGWSMARLGSLIGGPGPDPQHYSQGGEVVLDAQGHPLQYRTQDIRKGSEPGAEASRFPTLARGELIFRSAASHLAEFVEQQSPAALGANVAWSDGPQRVDALVMRLCFHNGMHAGQLTDLRRVLGMARVLPD